MFMNFAQNFLKHSSSPFSLMSLNHTSMFFKSRVKRSRVERIKRYLQNPRFKRIVKMKIPDFKDPKMTFPVTVPLRTTFVLRVPKTKPSLPVHDYLNFKSMTGNEILINLSNAEHLRPTELASGLLELSKRDKTHRTNWNNHDWVKNCVEVAIKNLPGYNTRVVSTLLWAFHCLNIKDPLLWSSLARESNKTIHRLRGKGFGLTFLAYFSGANRCTKEFKQRLCDLIPLHINNFNPDLFTSIFTLVLKEGYMTPYLFNDHFFMVIWKRNAWLRPRNYPALVDGLLDYGYTEDIEFWNQDFVPSFEKFINSTTAESAEQLLMSLALIKKNVPKVQASYIAGVLKERIEACKTTLKRVENAKFWNVVKNDIEYYRQKEKLRMEKERKDAVIQSK